jgi:hypothetical protein
VNLFTASKQLRELDEYLRGHYPKAKGRTVIDRVKWVLADVENRIRQADERVRQVSTHAAGTVTPKHQRAPPPRIPPAPVPYDPATGLPLFPRTKD